MIADIVECLDIDCVTLANVLSICIGGALAPMWSAVAQW